MNDLLTLEGLNKRDDIGKITIENLDRFELSKTEESFFRHYQPQNKLIIYGTLAPDKPNHHKMEGIDGDWFPAILKGGKLENKGWGSELGFKGYISAPADEQMDIPCYVLFSSDLVDNWEYLDDFEGTGYKRILAQYILDDEKKGFGYVYAISQ